MTQYIFDKKFQDVSLRLVIEGHFSTTTYKLIIPSYHPSPSDFDNVSTSLRAPTSGEYAIKTPTSFMEFLELFEKVSNGSPDNIPVPIEEFIGKWGRLEKSNFFEETWADGDRLMAYSHVPNHRYSLWHWISSSRESKEKFGYVVISETRHCQGPCFDYNKHLSKQGDVS